MVKSVDTMTTMKEECLKCLNETICENKRKYFISYLLVINVLMKLCIAVFMWRLCLLNLYYTVIGLAVIIIITFTVTIAYFVYHKKFRRTSFDDERIRFNYVTTILMLSFMAVKYDQMNFASKVNRLFVYKLQLLWHYLFYLPATMVFIYEFIRVFYLKTIIIMLTSTTLKIDNVTIANTFISTLYATNFDYYFYLLVFMCSSFIVIINVILLNKQISDETHEASDALIINRQLFNENNWLCSRFLHVNILFSFLFRYFFFLARALGLILTLISTIAVIKLSSNGDTGVVFSQNLYFYILIATLLVSYTTYVLLHFIEKLSEQNQTHRFETIAESIYHALIMMIDIDEKFFKHVTTTRCCKYYAKVKIGVFMLFTLTVSTLCAAYWYYWYYGSYNYTLLDNDSMLLLLLNSFSKFKYQLLTNFNYEQQIQEEIRFKQIMLVVICGCTLVSLLSFHIYYNYYFNYNFIDISKLDMFSEVKLCTLVTSSNSKNDANKVLLNQSNDLFTSTTEISTKCSTCYTISSSSSSAISSDNDDTTTSNFVKYHQNKKVSKYNYDTSSGFLSTVSSSSLSSSAASSYDKQFVDNLVDTITTTTMTDGAITQINLIIHNNKDATKEDGNSQNNYESFYDKVYSWFTKTQQPINEFNIQQQYRKSLRNSVISQQTTSDCSMII